MALLAGADPARASLLRWEGARRAGTLVEPGIYLYRLEAGTYRKEGKVTGPPNADYYVKFRCTTASGGTDSFILKLRVRALGPGAFRVEGVPIRLSPQPIPSQGRILFGVVPPGSPAAQLTILDLAGRIVARISVSAGGELTWDGRGEHGALALPGVYLYRLEMGPRRQEGKLVVVR